MQRKKMKPIVPSEDYEQVKTVVYLTKRNIPFYAIPNGGRRNYIEAVKFKRTGVQSGVPDICVTVARSGFHGLYIELKRMSGSRVSANQAVWIDILRKEGYRAEICFGFDEAKKVIEDYFG